jgi:hypothetical protein
VLSRFNSLDCPFGVKRMGGADIYGLNFAVCKQRLIASVPMGNAIIIGEGLGRLLLPRTYRYDFSGLCLREPMRESPRYRTGPDEPPLQCLHSVSSNALDFDAHQHISFCFSVQ